MGQIKRQLLSLMIFVCTILTAHAQVVDESINGVQIGFLGVWLHNESKIASRWAFRTEIGMEVPLTSGLGNYETLIPVISIEPRWYYNSSKRQGNSRNTFHNSTNYVTTAFRYYPKFIAVELYETKFINDADGGLFFIPTWGIRRNFNYRLNYEIGIGGGLDVLELFTSEWNTGDFTYNIHIRIGYKFGKKAFQTSK